MIRDTRTTSLQYLHRPARSDALMPLPRLSSASSRTSSQKFTLQQRERLSQCLPQSRKKQRRKMRSTMSLMSGMSRSEEFLGVVSDHDAFRDKRIFSTGCAGTMEQQQLPLPLTFPVEQTRMNDCYFDKKDWRVCSKEVGGRWLILG